MSRQERVAQAIKKEICDIIQNELNDPRLGFVTVTRVELTPDLRYAKVFFSVLGKEEEQKKSKTALDSALGFIRCLIAQRIRLRFAPEISLYEDKSAEYSIRIQELLDEVNKLNEPQLPSTRKARIKNKRKGRG